MSSFTAAGERSAFYWVLLAAFAVIAAGLGLRDPWPADEPRFALIARDMVETGSWFFPRVAGVLYPDKPPVYFWIMAAFYSLTGSLRLAFLLPSLCAALATLALVYDLGRRLWNREAGWWAAAGLAVSVQFLLFAKSARIDATLMMLVVLGIYGLLRHLLLGPDWKWYVAGFAACGLGIITKGVGFLPVLVLPVYALARCRGWGGLSRPDGHWWQWLAGPAAMIGVIALWLLPMLWLVHASGDPALEAYRDNILFKQTGERYADPWHHFEPPWYYLVEVVPLFWLPLSLALVWLIPAWAPAFRERDSRILLPLSWVVLVILFFTLSPAKRGAYLLPALPLLALSAGPYLSRIVNRRSIRVTALVLLALVAALFAYLLVWILADGNTRLEQISARYELDGEVTWLVLSFLLTAVFALALAWRRHAGAGLALWFGGAWIVVGLVGYPLINQARTPAVIMEEAAAAAGDGTLGLVGWKEQHILFAPRPVVHFGYRRRDWEAEVRDGLAWLLDAENHYLLMTDKFPTPCVSLSGARALGYRHRQNWYLVAPRDVAESCRPRLENAAPSRAIRHEVSILQK